MAQTTTQVSGCSTVIEVDDASNTPIDVSGSSQKFDLGFENNIGEAYTFEGTFPIRVSCKKNGSLSISVIYTRDGTEARALLESWLTTDGLRTISIYPEGKINGGRWYQGEYLLKGLKFSGDASDNKPMMMDGEFLPSGEVTRTNYTT